MSKGFVTIPTDSTFVDGTKKLMDYWGADAVRDCDGVSLPDDLKQFNSDVYKAYFVVREDHEYAKAHPEYLQNSALSSLRKTAIGKTLEIDLLEDTFKDQLEPNTLDYKKYWQVFDRTTGEQVFDFEYIGNNIVIINNTIPFHQYSVNFFAKILWDPVQIYNYHVNNWTCEKDIDMDPVYPEAFNHMLERLESWLIANPDVTVIRFTTFFYNFFLVFRNGHTQKVWDWFNYAMAASPAMFELFKNETGNSICLEDIVNGGYYLNKNVIPNEIARKYIDFIQRKCCGWAKQLVDLVHKYGRKAMMFDGDHRIGTEPYNPYFPTIGLDAVVGAPSDGIYIQQIANMPGIKYTEGRFSPYFFPNECPGDEKGTEMLTMFWDSEKRGMLRKPIDRIGFGGYLRQISEYPKFINKVKEVCDEFRDIKANAGKKGSKTFLKVAFMSYWGKQDSWMFFGRFVDDFTSYSVSSYTLLAAMCGQPVEVHFISFDEVMNNDLSEFDVLINAGTAGTSRQGDFYWKNPALLSKIREYVYNGGAFFGVKDPTGYMYQGKYFQLEDVLGVQKENDLNIFEKRPAIKENKEHWILKCLDKKQLRFLSQNSNVYNIGSDVLSVSYDPEFGGGMPDGAPNAGNIDLAVNTYGKGRSAYLSGIYESYDAYKLIYRILLWLSKKEYLEKVCYCENTKIDVFYYEDTNAYAVFNFSNDEIKSFFYDLNGKKIDFTIKGKEIVWFK